jgi:hypothetical protein
MENQQCSEEFLKIFDSHMGSFSLTCSCGKIHFDNYNTGSDEDELEKLLELSKKFPNNYIERDQSIGSIEIGNEIIVIGCDCNCAKITEDFLLDNMKQIVEYYKLKSKNVMKAAKELDKVILGKS